jgi:hypothetical protein
VRQRIAERLDEAPPGRIRVVSLCAGEGRDLLGVLPAHPRRGDVVARLVELDPKNAAVARETAAAAGLSGIEVVEGDASLTDAYRGAVPADLVLACGVFGNIVDADIERTIAMLPQLCAAGASVIWTRHRLPPDLTPTVRRWFAESGFAERSFDAPSEFLFSVGVNQLEREPSPLDPGQRMFAFVVG